MLNGFPTHSQTATAVMEAARKAGRALDVARIRGEGAGNEAPLSGGLRDQIGDPQLEVVEVSGTGTMTIQVVGSPYATRNGRL